MSNISISVSQTINFLSDLISLDFDLAVNLLTSQETCKKKTFANPKIYGLYSASNGYEAGLIDLINALFSTRNDFESDSEWGIISFDIDTDKKSIILYINEDCTHYKEAISLEEIISILNTFCKSDYNWMNKLLTTRYSCNSAIANHPTIQVAENNKVGGLGILNGLIGAVTEGDYKGWGYLLIDTQENSITCYNTLEYYKKLDCK